MAENNQYSVSSVLREWYWMRYAVMTEVQVELIQKASLFSLMK